MNLLLDAEVVIEEGMTFDENFGHSSVSGKSELSKKEYQTIKENLES